MNYSGSGMGCTRGHMGEGHDCDLETLWAAHLLYLARGQCAPTYTVYFNQSLIELTSYYSFYMPLSMPDRIMREKSYIES